MSDAHRIGNGLRWTIFSPLLLLMAGLSKTRSDTEYGLGLVLCGVWSLLGVVAGIARLAGASWAKSLQERLTLAILIV